jgi:hypothetical protein
MHRPGTNEDNVQMSDVLCDFCHRPWTQDVPMIEGHRGSVICGNCLSVACAALARDDDGDAGAGHTCSMCLESEKDRAALGRPGDPGWRSPMHPEAAICRRCADQAAGALERDPDFDWTKPALS